MFTSKKEVLCYLNSPNPDFSHMGEAVDFYQTHQKDTELLEALCICNKGLVYKSVKSLGIFNNLDDVYQDGYVGLVNAVEKYAYKNGIEFATFAFSYIRGYIISGYYTANEYGVSRRDFELITKMKNRILQAQNRGAPSPTNQELAIQLVLA